MPYYDMVKLPCANGEPHNFVRVARFPRIIGGNELYRCKWCEETKNVAVSCKSECTNIDKYGNYNCTECDVWRG